MELSRRIGVSPWTWWADVPVRQRPDLSLPVAPPEVQSPGVKYRGIFINDEDWGLKPWAAKTFDPAFGNIGPKTYEKVFELMLRLKLNYLWPAMHPCSREFASVPENAALADRYAVVMGASHCEPMLQNNVWWHKEQGPWRYDVNRDHILAYWDASVQARGRYEAVWTLGIRGIHDSGMQGPPDVPGRVALLAKIIADQRALIDRGVTHQWGPVAQCFVPYKEVQPLYDAGLEVPPDVTLVWADDDYGYLRRLSSPAERPRPGGAGFYYHVSYQGPPHSYTWVDTTPPALMWEEMRKAWDNDARTLWIINVGDIKPAEMSIDFFAGLAWDPAGSGPDAQPRFLRAFAERNFGPEHADEIAAFCAEFYRVAQVHKPECMSQQWVDQLTPPQRGALRRDYEALLDREAALAARLPAPARDAWTEMVGYTARITAACGLIFIEDQLARAGDDPEAHTAAVGKWRDLIRQETVHYNEQVAGGKWRHMMDSYDAPEKRRSYMAMIWPWNAKPPTAAPPAPVAEPPLTPTGKTVAATAFDHRRDAPMARWVEVAGLGWSGHAMAVEPASLQKAFGLQAGEGAAPTLEYNFRSNPTGGEVVLHLLPTFRLYPGMKLRVAVGVDDGEAHVVEVPCSSGAEDENGPQRRYAVRDNRVDMRVAFPDLAAGAHTLKIRPVDPGLVLDEITFP